RTGVGLDGVATRRHCAGADREAKGNVYLHLRLILGRGVIDRDEGCCDEERECGYAVHDDSPFLAVASRPAREFRILLRCYAHGYCMRLTKHVGPSFEFF